MKRSLAALPVTAVLAAGAAIAGSHPAPPAAAQAATLAPPTISEPFTLLACVRRPQTTLGLEGCVEHDIVATDKQIDGVVRVLLRLLPDDLARRDLAVAQRAWLAYRLADCRSVSDRHAHGTLAGVVAATCTADRSRTRLHDLRVFVNALRRP